MIFINLDKRISGRDIFVLHVLPALTIGLALFVLTIGSWQSAQERLHDEQQQHITKNQEEVSEVISNRMKMFEEVLRGAAAQFPSHDHHISRSEFNTYVERSEIFEDNSGISGIGYIQLVNSADLAAFTERVRAEEGPSTYTVYPSAEKDVYAPIVYVAPYNPSSRAMGFDSYSNQQRRETMEASRDKNEATLTKNISLINQVPGFIMYVPVYKAGAPFGTTEERRQNITGYVFGGFRTDKLFAAMFQRQSELFGFALNAQGENGSRTLYSTSSYDTLKDEPSSLHMNQTITIGNQDWDLQFAASPDIAGETDSDRPQNILIFGSLASVAVAVTVLLALLSRTARQNDAEEFELQKAKDDLLSLASHQLRTPATGVKQYLGMLIEGYAGKLPKQQRFLAEKAYESNQRQLATINEMLSVAKADAGRMVLNKERIDIVRMVKDVIAEQQKEIETKEIALKKTLPSRAVFVLADKTYVRMAIENVITNAIKYTHEHGKVTVKISKTGKEAMLSVSDTGVGISSVQKKQVFKKFSRVYNELTSQTSGSGIGLYLARQILRAHNGTIDFTSVEGKGSTFFITLPLAEKK